MKILIFDTETTGLPIERNPLIKETKKWPYIIQFSFILYDIQNSAILDLMNEIICLDDSIQISEKSIEIHKITKEMSKEKGISIVDSLNRFNEALLNCDMVIAHNLDFDKNLVLVECLRNNIQQKFNFDNRIIPEYCTMKNNINLCKIERTNYRGDKYYKYPSLSELYMQLFNIVPNGLHDSMVDVLLCLRSFVMLRYKHDVLTREPISNLFWKYKINSGNTNIL